MGKPVIRAILDGAQQIATPAFVATLCICIVFVPVVFITGVGEVPLHAARLGGRLRDAGELLPLAHRRADHGALPAPGRGAPARPGRRAHRGRWRRIWAVHQAFNRRFDALPGRLSARCSPGRSDHAGASSPAASRASWRSRSGLFSADRHGLLPDGRRRASSACTSAARPARASRRPRAASPRSRT